MLTGTTHITTFTAGVPHGVGDVEGVCTWSWWLQHSDQGCGLQKGLLSFPAHQHQLREAPAPFASHFLISLIATGQQAAWHLQYQLLSNCMSSSLPYPQPRLCLQQRCMLASYQHKCTKPGGKINSAYYPAWAEMVIKMKGSFVRAARDYFSYWNYCFLDKWNSYEMEGRRWSFLWQCC